jgi:hypothetical protein
MEIMKMLETYGMLNIAVVIGVITIMSRARSIWLDEFLNNFQYYWIRWIVLNLVSLILSFALTALFYIKGFIILEWLKMSLLNWIFSWTFHDAIKNLFFKKDMDV